MSVELSEALEAIRSRTDIDAVVWIYLNRGSEKGLSFPGGGLMDSPALARFCIFPKPLFIILDCCSSGTIARQALELISPTRYVAFLTSSPGTGFSSAFVLSDDPTLVEPRPGGVPYFVFSSIFSRDLLDFSVYQQQAITLSKLPIC
jgi:hypothetical protein